MQTVGNRSSEIFIGVSLPFQMFICCLTKAGACKSAFRWYNSPCLFIAGVNWILREGLQGERDFYTLKYSFENTAFDSGVKDRLIDKMINRKHDKWNFNEAVSFIRRHVFLNFLLWCVFVATIGSSWNLLFLWDWTCLPMMPRPLNNAAFTLISDQTDGGSPVALGFNFLQSLIDDEQKEPFLTCVDVMGMFKWDASFC